MMIFLPNASFNSPFVLPTIQHVGLEKMSKKFYNDTNEM
jgi:hypothetical protein